MLLFLAGAILGPGSFAAPPATRDTPECHTGKECLALARKAIERKHWKRAESWAAYALDWAEPRDAAETQTAFRLAAQANFLAKKPLRAFAWTEAGLRYPGPWASGIQRPPDSREELERLYRKLQPRVAATPSLPPFTGVFIQYAGRGIWDELTLTQAEPGRYRWHLNAYRVGRGEAPIRVRGPAQMSEDNEGIGTRMADVLSIEYESAEIDSKPCRATIELAPAGVNVVEGTPDCYMGNRGVRPWGRYFRVESLQ